MTSTSVTIGVPTIDVADGRAVWSVTVDHPALPPCLWFTVPERFQGMLTGRADPALLVLTIPALRLGASIEVEGIVTDELVFRFEELCDWYRELGHGTGPVSLNAPRQAPAEPRAAGVATGFSAGIDSYAVLAERHYAADVPEGEQLTHLLFNNVGSHTSDATVHIPGARQGRIPEEHLNQALAMQHQLWRTRLEQKQDALARIGLPCIDVDSNVVAFQQQGAVYELVHTPCNAAVAHLLSGGIGQWLYAGGFHLDEIGVPKQGHLSMARIDPLILPLLSSSGLRLEPSGSTLARVDKTVLVAPLEDARNSLDVCVARDDGTNCSRCPKCQTTMATLEILGHLEAFSGRFDLDRWRDGKPLFYGRLAVRRPGNVNALQVLDLAREHGVTPPSGRFRALAGFVANKLKREVRSRVSRRSRS